MESIKKWSKCQFISLSWEVGLSSGPGVQTGPTKAFLFSEGKWHPPKIQLFWGHFLVFVNSELVTLFEHLMTQCHVSVSDNSRIHIYFFFTLFPDDYNPWALNPFQRKCLQELCQLFLFKWLVFLLFDAIPSLSALIPY